MSVEFQARPNNIHNNAKSLKCSLLMSAVIHLSPYIIFTFQLKHFSIGGTFDFILTYVNYMNIILFITLYEYVHSVLQGIDQKSHHLNTDTQVPLVPGILSDGQIFQSFLNGCLNHVTKLGYLRVQCLALLFSIYIYI